MYTVLFYSIFMELINDIFQYQRNINEYPFYVTRFINLENKPNTDFTITLISITMMILK